VRVRIVGDVGGYAGTSAKCLLRAACHSCGPYRVPNVDAEAKAVFTNNPTSGAMRGFGTNQAHFAMEGIMDMLAERVGVDGYDIRERNILNPGDAFATGQIMRESVAGLRRSLEAVKDVYKSARYAGIGCGIKSTGIGNGTIDSGHAAIRVLEGGVWMSSPATPRWARGSSPPFARRCAKKPACRPRSWMSAGKNRWAPSAARPGRRAPPR
jgi:CO/xanthine dehydrogenase Mo-binding subunit